MITEDRLQEMEQAPREAMIGRVEIRELTDAYRAQLKSNPQLEALNKALPLLIELWNAVETGYLEHNWTERKGKALLLQQLMIEANAANDRVRSLLNL